MARKEKPIIIKHSDTAKARKDNPGKRLVSIDDHGIAWMHQPGEKSRRIGFAPKATP